MYFQLRGQKFESPPPHVKFEYSLTSDYQRLIGSSGEFSWSCRWEFEKLVERVS